MKIAHEKWAKASAFRASRPGDWSVSTRAFLQLQHTLARRAAGLLAAAFFPLLLGMPAVGAQSGWLAKDGSALTPGLSTGGSRVELTSANAPAHAAISLHGGDFRSLDITGGHYTNNNYGGAVNMIGGATANFFDTTFNENLAVRGFPDRVYLID